MLNENEINVEENLLVHEEMPEKENNMLDEIMNEAPATDMDNVVLEPKENEEIADAPEAVVPADDREINVDKIDDLSETSDESDDSKKNAIKKTRVRDRALNSNSMLQAAPKVHHEIGTDPFADNKNIVNDYANESQEEANYRYLQVCSNTKEIIYGVVMGCFYNKEKTKNLLTGKEIDGRIIVNVTIPNCPEMHVYIPEEEYFMDYNGFGNTYANLSESEKIERRKKYINDQIFARIPLIITKCARTKISGKGSLDSWQAPYTYAIAGSRKQAMLMLQHIWFFDTNPNSPHINKDDVYRANVLQVWENAVRVECCGVESNIRNYDLTGRQMIDNAREYVENGDQIFVKPMKMYIHRKGEINAETGEPYENDEVYMSVSGRLYDTGYKPKELSFIVVGGMYGGVVASFNSNNNHYTVNLLNGVRAAVRRDLVIGKRNLTRGDKVIVRVIKIMDSYVEGSAKRMGKL